MPRHRRRLGRTPVFPAGAIIGSDFGAAGLRASRRTGPRPATPESLVGRSGFAARGSVLGWIARLRPNGFSHRLRDEKTLIYLCWSLCENGGIQSIVGTFGGSRGPGFSDINPGKHMACAPVTSAPSAVKWRFRASEKLHFPPLFDDSLRVFPRVLPIRVRICANVTPKSAGLEPRLRNEPKVVLNGVEVMSYTPVR